MTISGVLGGMGTLVRAGYDADGARERSERDRERNEREGRDLDERLREQERLYQERRERSRQRGQPY